MRLKLLLCLSIGLMLKTSLAFPAVNIKTNPIRYIGIDTAISGGNILNTGGEQITEAGVCWSTTPQPTINDSKSIRPASTDSFTCILRNLVPEKGYYIRAYAITATGTFYGPQRTFATDKAIMGMPIKGGRLFYVLAPGDPGYVQGELHGLVVANNTVITHTWKNTTDTFLNVTDTAMFTGLANTNQIVAALGEGNYAAKYCYDLVSGGYNDWYLPSQEELYVLIKQSIGPSGQAWSSSEVNAINAIQVSSSRKRAGLKVQKLKIYPIRKF